MTIPPRITVPEILGAVEKTINTKGERQYFLIHEARYRYVLEHINTITKTTIQRERQNDVALRQTQGQTPQRTKKLRVLDVGCFPYHLGAALEMMGHEVYGIASGHEPLKHKNINIINIEKDTFPYKDNFFDLVVFTEVLEHIPQSPILALKEMERVTKPGGHILLTTPNIARSINRGKLAAGRSIMYPVDDLLDNDGNGSTIYMRHNREYTMRELVRLVSAAGWHVEKQEYFVSYTPFRKRVRPDPLLLWLGKFVNFLAMELVPSLRDTLLVVGKKQ